MLNFIWAGMVIIGIIYAAINGTMAEVSDAALESAKSAVSLCITMLGVMSLWLGMMQVARAAGILERLTVRLAPLLRFLFPGIPKGHTALEAISLNMVANLLGLGWAATPAGLKAMKELEKLEQERKNPAYQEYIEAQRAGEETGRKKERCASNEMCTFLIINISSLQLIPVNMIAYRSQYGSVNPAGIIVPAILATLFSTIIAVLYCRIRSAGGRRAEKKRGFFKGS